MPISGHDSNYQANFVTPRVGVQIGTENLYARHPNANRDPNQIPHDVPGGFGNPVNFQLSSTLSGLLTHTEALARATQNMAEEFKTMASRLDMALGGSSKIGSPNNPLITSVYGTGSGVKAIPVTVVNTEDLHSVGESFGAKASKNNTSGLPSNDAPDPNKKSQNASDKDEDDPAARKNPGSFKSNQQTGKSFKNVANALSSATKNWNPTGKFGQLAKSALAGGAEGGIGASLGAIPVAGEVIAGLGMAYGLAEGIGGFVAGQRAKNASFQSIYGTSNAAGFGQRIQQQMFQMSQMGVLSGSASDQLFMGVSKTGMQGDARNAALGFATTNYKQLGMSPDESLKFINLAAYNASQNLQIVGAALDGITQSAAGAGVSADVARTSFLNMYNGLVNAGAGGAAAITAQAGTSFFTSMGRTASAGSFDFTSNRAAAMLAAQMGPGTTIGQAQSAMARGAGGAILRGSAEQSLINRMILQPHSDVVALAKTFGGPKHGQYYANVNPGSGIGAAILSATPGGYQQIDAILQSANIDTSKLSNEGKLAVYANILTGRGNIATAAQRAAIINKEKLHDRTLSNNADPNYAAGIGSMLDKHGERTRIATLLNKTLGSGGLGFEEAAHAFEVKSHQKAMISLKGANGKFGPRMSIQEALQTDPQAIHDGNYKFTAEDPTLKIPDAGKGKDKGKASTGTGTLKIVMDPSISNMLRAVVMNQPSGYSIQPSGPGQGGAPYATSN